MRFHHDMVAATGPIARIRGQGGVICGTGFLIGDRHVMTCAHVIDDACGRQRGTEAAPDDAILLDLPFLDHAGLTSTLVAWFPMRSLADLEQTPVSDIAVLELAQPVPGGIDSRNARLSTPAPGTAFLTYGYPAGIDNGTQATGELLLTDSGGWRQIRDTQELGYFVEPGFSGAPVFDAKDNKLLGLVAAADQDARRRLGFVIPTPTLSQAWPLLAKPYKELFAFGEDDVGLFFGRDLFVEELATKVDRHPFLTVIGPSGSGKSSVVMAGLVPRLKASGGWAVVQCRPGMRPLYRLAHAISELTASIDDTTGNVARRATELEEVLRADPVRIVEHADTVVKGMPGIDRILLVVDQFEELFTHDDPKRVGAEDARESSQRQAELISVLAVIGRQKGRTPPIQVIATMRADFTGRALQDRTLADLMRDADVKLGPMTASEIAQAIEAPARRFGVTYEPGLVPNIVATMVDSTGGLPLMQFALDRLWRQQVDKRLTNDAYSAIGGVEGALSDHAEETYQRLDVQEQSAARRVLSRLVRLATPGEQAEDTRAVVGRAEIGEADWPMVRDLSDARLIMTGRDPATGSETAEVVHEALIRSWGRFRSWLDEDREFGLWRQRLRTDLARWDGKTPDALLRGALLAEAEAWLTARKDDFNEAEKAFVSASIEQSQKEETERQRQRDEHQATLEKTNKRQRKMLWVVGLLAALAVAGVVGVGFLAREWNAALARSDLNLMIAKRNIDLANQREDMLNQALMQREDALWEADDARSQAESDRDQAQQALDMASRQKALAEENAERARQAEQAAIANATEAKGRQLAAEARNILNEVGGPEAAERAAALAIESWKRRKSSVAYQVAVTSLQELPVIKIEHGGGVLAVAFSPDGTRLATASKDGTARILDAASGDEVARIVYGDRVTAVAFSPDGAHLATGSRDGTVRLLDAASGEEFARIEHGGGVTAVDFSPDGTLLVTASENGTVRIVDATSGEEIASFEHGGAVSAVAFSPDGTRFATGSRDRTARILGAYSGEEFARLVLGGWVTAVAFSPDGTRLAIASRDEITLIMDAVTGEEIARLVLGGGVTAVVFSPDGTRLATGSDDGTARILDAASGEEIARIENGGWVFAVAFSRDGTRLATGNEDGTARILDVAKGDEIARSEDGGWVNVVTFSPDGTRLATASEDGTVRILDVASWDEVARIEHGGWVYAVAFSPDGTRLATASEDGTARILDAASGEEIARFEQGGQVFAVAFSPDGTRLVTAGEDGTARILDAVSREEIARIEHDLWVYAVAFSPDGTRLVTASADGSVHILDPTSGEEIARFEHGGAVTGVAFSPDGTRLATASDDGTARVLNAASAEEIARIVFDGEVFAVVFSPDGTRLATASEDGTARILNAASGEEIARNEHGEGVNAVAFSPDGTRLATASDDGSARILDAVSGEEIARIEHGGGVTAVAFSPDGTRLATAADKNGLVRLISADPNTVFERLCRERAGRNLTRSEWARHIGTSEPWRATCPHWRMLE